jgi:hypothetical protein
VFANGLCNSGEKNGFNIFQSSGISWVCSTFVNEEQDFSVFFCPYLPIQLHEKLIKVAEVIHELEFTVYLVGIFYISEAVAFVVLASHQER